MCALHSCAQTNATHERLLAKLLSGQLSACTGCHLQLCVNELRCAARLNYFLFLFVVAGAGKTTLMDVLAGRKTAGRMEGQVWVGGYPKEQHSFARICGYVEQNDIHTPRVNRSICLGKTAFDSQLFCDRCAAHAECVLAYLPLPMYRLSRCAVPWSYACKQTRIDH